MAHGDQDPDTGRRRSGVVRRSHLARQRPSTARRDALALVGVGGLSVVVLLVVLSLLGGRSVVSPSPTPTRVAVASSTPTLKPTFSPEASPSPTPSPVPSPSPTASPTPTHSPMPSPTPPPVGLVILEPDNGSTTSERAIAIRGLAAPGSVITRDVPLWFDEHTTADSAGHWSFVEPLNVGENSFTFRVADDRTTEITLIVYYRPL